ncbi:MAG: hypothetical protein QM775_00545 [Pirellulales bacterium]
MRALSTGVGLLMLAISAAGQAAEPVSVKESAKTQTPTPIDLAVEANRLLRETAVALQSQSIEAAEQPAFVALLNTAEALKSADKPAPSERERLRALTRVRLRQAADVLARQAQRDAAKRSLASDKRPATVAEPASTTLAQQLAPQNAVAGLGMLSGAASPTTTAGNTAELESARELMDVISRSIQPESWEDAGGRGVIRYWALGHALVITGTSDVHNGVGDLIEQLRRAP